MSNTRNQCDGVGHATKSEVGLDRDFAQLTQSYQAHGGEVNTGTTPQVQYSYADGSSNTIRITGMTYPNGRNVVDDYGTAGSMNDAASPVGFACLTSCGHDFRRFQASEQRERLPWYRAVRPTGSRAMPLFGMKDSGASSNLVEYSYLGLSGFVKTVYPESSAQYTLIGTTGGTNPDSGDIYLGLDRFGRVIDANWANVAGTTTLARVKYGYNRVSSRTWRDNLSPGMTGYDELYGYDQLQRLQNLGRGTLNGTQTAITSPTFGQDWTLDETGNWNGFKQDNTGSGTWNLDQARTANTVNEITSLVNETSKAWTTPAYDKAGNMTRIPVPGTLPDGVAWNTMSLSDWDNLKLVDWEEMTLDNVEGVYDAWNRLVRLHVGDTTLAEYTYDARGYRIRKDSYTDGTLTEARHYYYTPGWQVVEERVGTSTTADRQFVWGLRYIDDLVLRDRDTDGNGTLDERRYGLQDGNWNTIALTNPFGIVTERFSYDAYGVPTFLTDTGTVLASSSTGWEVLYAGYRWDGDPSKMYYVRNRLLLPFLGTWNRRDPAGYGDSLNFYESCLAQPLVAIDPSGSVIVFTSEAAAREFVGQLSASGVDNYHMQGDKTGNYFVGVDRTDPDRVFDFVNSRLGMPKKYSSLNKRTPKADHNLIERRNRMLEALMLNPFELSDVNGNPWNDSFSQQGYARCNRSINDANKKAPPLILDIGGEGPISPDDQTRSNRYNFNVSNYYARNNREYSIPRFVARNPPDSAPPFPSNSLDGAYMEFVTISAEIARTTANQIIPLLKNESPFTVITPARNFAQQNAVEEAFKKSGRPYTREDSYDTQRGESCDKSVFRLKGAR